jgi:hypothetical protein
MYQRPNGTWVNGGGFTQGPNGAWPSPSRPGWIVSGGGLTSGGPGGYTGFGGNNALANGRQYVPWNAEPPPQFRYQGCMMGNKDPFKLY